MFVCICTIWFIWWNYTARLRKFRKSGVLDFAWKQFKAFWTCLNISLNCFLKCLCTFLWICFENVFERPFEKQLKICLKNCFEIVWKFQNVFKKVSKHIEMLENFKHWQLNNLQLLSLRTSHWGNGNDCRFRHPQGTEKQKIKKRASSALRENFNF